MSPSTRGHAAPGHSPTSAAPTHQAAETAAQASSQGQPEKPRYVATDFRWRLRLAQDCVCRAYDQAWTDTHTHHFDPAYLRGQIVRAIASLTAAAEMLPPPPSHVSTSPEDASAQAAGVDHGG